MALSMQDGFDIYTTAAQPTNRGWSFTTAATTSTAATIQTGRYGGKALGLGGAAANGTGGMAQRSLPVAASTVILGAGFRQEAAVFGTFAQRIIRLLDGSTVQMSVQIEADGRLSVVRGTTVLATSTQSLSPQVWAWIEFKAVIHPSTGTYELRVDGVTWLTATGQNTRSSAANQVTALVLTGSSNAGSFGGGVHSFDDLLVMDGTGSALNDFLGDARIETLMPTGDSAVQWTPSGAGTNAAQVNEAQLVTTNYVSSAASGNVDTYDLANLSNTPTTIHGVAVVWSASKTDAGARSAGGGVVSGSTAGDGATKSLGSGPAYYEDFFAADPATAAAWDAAGVNAAQLRLRDVA